MTSPASVTRPARGLDADTGGRPADLDGVESAVAVGKRAMTDGTRRKDPT